MSHIQYTINRSGTYYYNRRVPSHAVPAYGTHIRQALSACPVEAEAYATRLSNVLEASWAAHKTTTPINIPAVVNSFKPKAYLLSEMAEEYISLKKIDRASPNLSLASFIELAGDRDVTSYVRDDAKLFVNDLQRHGNKTATIRSKVNSICAILNYAYAELDVDKRNPFSRLFIKGEGQDAHKRGTFTLDQLKRGYDLILRLAFFSASAVLFGFIHALFRALPDVVVLGVLRLLLVKRRSGFVAYAVLSGTAFTHRNLLLVYRSWRGFDRLEYSRLSPHRLPVHNS